jgi:hypothetical protein
MLFGDPSRKWLIRGPHDAVLASARDLLWRRVMKNLNLTANASHPIHHALSELHLFVTKGFGQAPSTEAARLIRATIRARGAVKIAGAGVRRGHHLGVAIESLLWAQNGFEVLLLNGKIEHEMFDEARRRLDQVLQGLERLSGAADGSWSTVELPKLEAPSTDLAEDATIKPLRLLVARVTELVLGLRNREGKPAPKPTTPTTKAA